MEILPVGAALDRVRVPRLRLARRPRAGEQTIASRGRPFVATGPWASTDGRPRGRHRAGRRDPLSTGMALARWTWCFVALRWRTARPRSAISVAAIRARTGLPRTGEAPAAAVADDAMPWCSRRRSTATGGPALRRPARPAAADRPGARRGRPCRPSTRRTRSTPSRGLIGAWDFAATSGPTASPTSPARPPRPTVNMPTRGVTGDDFDGTVTDYRRRPSSTARSTSIATTSRTPAGMSTWS